MSYLIVGLGNPGQKFIKTRHNVGRFVLDKLVASLSDDNKVRDWEKRVDLLATRAQIKFNTKNLTLLLPDTFMNLSGNSVAKTIKKEKIKIEDVIVVHDDLALPLGEIKISFGRGSGGHNGVQSIIEALGGKEFIRLRIGITPLIETDSETKTFWLALWRRFRSNRSSFVLLPFTEQEMKSIEILPSKVREIISIITEQGLTSAMNQFNSSLSK